MHPISKFVLSDGLFTDTDGTLAILEDLNRNRVQHLGFPSQYWPGNFRESVTIDARAAMVWRTVRDTRFDYPLLAKLR